MIDNIIKVAHSVKIERKKALTFLPTGAIIIAMSSAIIILQSISCVGGTSENKLAIWYCTRSIFHQVFLIYVSLTTHSQCEDVKIKKAKQKE